MQLAEATNENVRSEPARPPGSSYWDQRKDSLYLFAARAICGKYGDNPSSVLDVGSNRTPTLEWHRPAASRLVSVDLRHPYRAEGVESLKMNFFDMRVDRQFDLVTCFQVLEHVPDAQAFALKLLEVGRTLVVSVPYKWRKGSCKYHIHDPVDEGKMRDWFGREADFSYVAKEIGPRNPDNKHLRLIQVYRSAA